MSEDKLWKLVLSIHHVGPGNHTWVGKLGYRSLYLVFLVCQSYKPYFESFTILNLSIVIDKIMATM